MSAKNKGVIKNIQDRCGKVLGCHCQAHLLNLCVVSACKFNSVVVMMNKLRCVQEFFDFPKRLSLLSGMIDECDLPQIKKKKLKDCCRTRWVQRVDSFTIFLDLFKVICNALSHISEDVGGNWNSDSITLASCHLLPICNFEFIINLVVVSELMMYTRSLTVRLQSRKMDISKAFCHVKTLESTLAMIRDKVDSYHVQWYQEAVSVAAECNVLPEHKRKHLSLDEFDEICAHYRISLTVPFIDSLMVSVNDRFSVKHEALYAGFQLLPAVLLKNKNWRTDLKMFVDEYSDDIDSVLELKAELDMWEMFWNKEVSCHKMDEDSDMWSIQSVLFQTDKEMFPAIYSSLKLLGTFPVTSCECERSISVMRRLKTYLRSTTCQERFSSLALINIHRSFPHDIERIVTVFADRKKRRMQLTNILDDAED